MFGGRNFCRFSLDASGGDSTELINKHTFWRNQKKNLLCVFYYNRLFTGTHHRHRGEARFSGKGVHMYKGSSVDGKVRFADSIYSS